MLHRAEAVKKQDASNTEYFGRRELHNSEVMSNYNENIVRQALVYSCSAKRIVDFGAGIGTLSLIFKKKFGKDVQCVEIDKTNREFLSRRNLKHYSSLDEIEGSVDLIFSSNVLEHIQDDVSALTEMKGKLRDGGAIFLYLPAKMILGSELDEEIGHFRRYEIPELKRKCERVGLKVERLHYADSIGFLASLLMKVVGYNAESGIGSAKSLKFYDKWIFPVSKIIDKIGHGKFFGKNIVLLATKRFEE